QVQFELKLTNINSIQSRIEEYNDKKFDGVISRAFASLQDMLNWCKHLPNEQGFFYALKGSDIDPIADGFTLKQNIKLTIPELDAERCLIIIQ
ncbi:MAG: class I SAM-dependent methyltransferase, partial [Gilliamella sp.]|nr:class I SAM-dependent methyltransferase [Gilliamella sp.]